MLHLFEREVANGDVDPRLQCLLRVFEGDLPLYWVEFLGLTNQRPSGSPNTGGKHITQLRDG